ncbi:MAG: polysaccharide pyruvyl transferase family protein, partial [bacterium]|nr:polysaccharide pyruvyl transferase family protein [bacterium]
MKRYLVRAGFDPLKTYNPDDCVCKSFVGDNTGNLFFAYGVMNALFTEETEIEQTYKWKWTDEEADLINEKFDAFILPMADGFRIDFMEYLSGITNLVNRLTIPVVVIGVGLRAPYEPDMSSGFPFDEIVTDFVKAILEHSAIIGLRGEITYKYLEKLSFKGDRDFTVIGCPSLYTYGNNLHTKSLK